MILEGKHILLGVTGGIAAYKSANLLRTFQKQGAEVRVMMTASALRFIGVETFKTLSRHEVAIDVFSDNNPTDWTKHIHWAEWADCMVIAPCTANTLAKIANGISDNMLTSVVLAARCPIAICPTMDGEMFEAPATQRNLQLIHDFGYHVIEPDSGYLASGLVAKGRLPEDEVILKRIVDIIQKKEIKKILAGKKVLITAGATREFFDPVRFISNPSTGKMGMAMAKAAQVLGGEVTLIHGTIQVPVPEGIQTVSIESAEELFQKVKEISPDIDVGIFVAAVSDYAPFQKSNQKIKKSDDSLTINMKKTPDSLAWFGENKRKGQLSIGFAMETQNVIEQAKEKRLKKNADYIIANTLSDGESGFSSDKNEIFVISENEVQTFSGLKEDIALSALRAIFGASHR